MARDDAQDKRLWRSVMPVISSEKDDKDRIKGLGTAFVCGQTGNTRYLLTCWHVVETIGEENLRVMERPTRVVAHGDKALDLALLAVDDLPESDVLVLSKAGQAGQLFHTIGHFWANDKEQDIPDSRKLDGWLGSQRRKHSDVYSNVDGWEFSVRKDSEFDKIRAGYSGAPVFDSLSGRVVAVISHQEGESLGHAVSVSNLMRIYPKGDAFFDHLSDTPTPLGPHEQVTIEKLGAVEAQSFLGALQKGFPRRFPDTPVPQNAAEMVHWFSSRSNAEVQPLFYLVRRALEAQKEQTRPESQNRAAEKAAALLYCIAACRLVDTAVARENKRHGEYVLIVPPSETIICAVIATALFGGSLHFKPPDPNDPPDLPRAEWVLDVSVSPNGDGLTPSFECAAYAAVFKNSREITNLCLDSNGLTSEQHARLAALIDDIKDRELSLALVIRGVTQPETVAKLADELQLPMLLSSTDMNAKLLGMDAERLKAEIGRFWLLVEKSHDAASTTPAPPSAPGEQTMSKPSININGPVSNLALSTGDHSAAQTGANSVANIGHKEGIDLAELPPLFQELLAAIAELPSAKARETLTQHVQTAQNALVEQNPPEPGRAKQALNAVKSATEVLEGGEKILGLCNKLYQLAAPLLGLPTP